MVLSGILTLIVLLLIAILIIKFIISYGGLILKIGVHLLAGWILLGFVNIVPGIDIPINLLTIIISGFGGVFGTFVLVLLSLI
ncbi:pro-sigmaK processing inhibitor BofA family protein [Methanosphaera sp.]